MLGAGGDTYIMFGQILLVLVVMDLILLWLWLLRIHTELKRFRDEINNSWIQLREALFLRREIMPYLVGSISFQEIEALEAIGNACDLASSSTGVADQTRAEARLAAALRRLFTLIDKYPAVKDDPNFQRLNRELELLANRIEFLTTVYNKQVVTYNAKLDASAAKVLSLFIALSRIEQFEIDAEAKGVETA